MSAPKLPDPQSQEYLWWQAGTIDEFKARNEGLNPKAIELRETLEALAKLHPVMRETELIRELARIYAPELLKRRFRR